MRRFVCAALTLFAIPAFAQDTPRAEHEHERDHEVEIVVEDEDGPVRFHIERDGPHVLFRGQDGERVFDLDMPEMEQLHEFRFEGDSPFAVFRDGAANRIFNVLRSGSVSAETRERIEVHFEVFAKWMRDKQGVDPELVIREGVPVTEILAQIDEDPEVGVLVLGAATDKKGPGPLITAMTKQAGELPIPMTIVPGDMSKERLEAIS